ncbi:MAG TPA: ABC transporter permease, partial [Bryobacteraceae bacterium]|nr:ABC transporter permease [Bryobacteraceae bacterium]
GGNDVFCETAAMESMSGDVHGRFGGASSELEPVKVQLVSGNYFGMLGVPASAGRVFTQKDDRTPGSAAVAVMRYGYWQRRFARDPSVVGRSLSLNGTVFTVVGIAASEFFGTDVGRAPDLWIPLAAQGQVQPWLDHPLDAHTQSLWLIGRMKPAVNMAQAQAYVERAISTMAARACGSGAFGGARCGHAESQYKTDRRSSRHFTATAGVFPPAADFNGSGWLSVTDCLRQYRESFVGAGGGAATGNRGSGGARRPTAKIDEPIACRKSSSRAGWWGIGIAGIDRRRPSAASDGFKRPATGSAPTAVERVDTPV